MKIIRCFLLRCNLQTVNISRNQPLDNIVKGLPATEVEMCFNYVGGMSNFIFGDVWGKWGVILTCYGGIPAYISNHLAPFCLAAITLFKIPLSFHWDICSEDFITLLKIQRSQVQPEMWGYAISTAADGWYFLRGNNSKTAYHESIRYFLCLLSKPKMKVYGTFSACYAYKKQNIPYSYFSCSARMGATPPSKTVTAKSRKIPLHKYLQIRTNF